MRRSGTEPGGRRGATGRPSVRWPAIVGGAVLLAGAVSAPASEDDGIPEPVTTGSFGHLLTDSPFRRLLSLSEALVLSGVAELPRGTLVSVYNRMTNETFVVGEQPNPQGWRLVAVEGSDDLAKVVARIEAGGQEVVLRFSPDRIEPPTRRRPSATLPGRRDEALVVVESFLRSLDPEAAGFFEGLPPAGQEDFREAFATYLKTYPEASDADKIRYARTQLRELVVGDGGGGEGVEAGDEAGGEIEASAGPTEPDVGGN